MAVRKIPLKQRPYLTDKAAESNSAEMGQASSGEGINNFAKSLDPAAQNTLALIRKKVLSDRALHDKASLVARVSISHVRCGWNWELLISSISFRL
jgi:hypothetical protein